MNAAETDGSAAGQARWLLLIHQLPAKPAYPRVKIWRRLQGIGAVAVKNAVYALPANEETREDFEWLVREITEGGGEAMVCEARLINGLSDQQVRALFDRARDADYEEIARQASALARSIESDAGPEKRAERRAQVVRLRKRLTDIAEIDFFGANGRETAEGLISSLEERLRDEGEPAQQAEPAPVANAIGKDVTWVTRKGVHVDRIASAWLIRRFIDQDARFKFVPGKGYIPEPGELRFDMFEAEFTHEGDSCTFEVLLARTGLDDPALKPIAEIVHDIDLKDEKFGREEAGGIKTLIAGICMATGDDEERIARGAAVFENLYQFFRKKRSL